MAASLRATVVFDAPRSLRTPANRRSMRWSIRRASSAWAPAHSASWPRSTPYARRVFSAMPRARSAASKPARSAAHVPCPAVASEVFFIDYERGRVATRKQLTEAGGAEEGQDPPRPWPPIRGPSDASTMWYAVMRKRTRGVFIGTLCIRHTGRQASLQAEGWEGGRIAEIGVQQAGWF